jgi:hypothetical protein
MNLSDYIINKSQLHQLVVPLRCDTLPLWGKMNPQQMIEHLVDEVTWTNGRNPRCCVQSAEEARNCKQVMIHSDAIIPRNYYGGELPDYLIYPDLAGAIDQLFEELSGFDAYFKSPGATAMHPLFGPLSHGEWLIWQDKHFSHHLKQFGLLPLRVAKPYDKAQVY